MEASGEMPQIVPEQNPVGKIRQHVEEVVVDIITPIPGVFSPEEEVKKLWSVPKEKRREAVETFKDNLARQRLAWACCQVMLENEITENPDLPKDQMLAMIDCFGKHYGFSEKQRETAEKMIDHYLEARHRVLDAVQRFPDKIDLINHVTGQNFAQNKAEFFEIEIGSMTIDIYCPGLEAGIIFHGAKSPEIDQNFDSAGFFSSSGGEKPVYYTVINTDKDPQEQQQHTHPHEQQHAKNKLLKTAGIFSRNERAPINIKDIGGRLRRRRLRKLLSRPEKKLEESLWNAYAITIGKKRKKVLLTEYMRIHRDRDLGRAKSEILAIERGGEVAKLSVFCPDGPYQKGYDYLEDLRDHNSSPLWQEVSQQVLIDEYQRIIDQAIKSFHQLSRLDNYTPATAIALLEGIPLRLWPKAVKRQQRDLKDQLGE